MQKKIREGGENFRPRSKKKKQTSKKRSPLKKVKFCSFFRFEISVIFRLKIAFFEHFLVEKSRGLPIFQLKTDFWSPAVAITAAGENSRNFLKDCD